MTRQEAEARVNAELAKLRGHQVTEPDDELDEPLAGDQTIQLVNDYRRGRVCLRLDLPVEILTFTSDQARQLGQELRLYANRLDSERSTRRRR